jgi:hypothetical protein
MSYAIRAEAEARHPVVSSQGRDPRAWAKRIIYRAERNDKSLLHVQIQFAYEAMGLEVPKAADAI